MKQNYEFSLILITNFKLRDMMGGLAWLSSCLVYLCNDQFI